MLVDDTILTWSPREAGMYGAHQVREERRSSKRKGRDCNAVPGPRSCAVHVLRIRMHIIHENASICRLDSTVERLIRHGLHSTRNTSIMQIRVWSHTTSTGITCIDIFLCVISFKRVFVPYTPLYIDLSQNTGNQSTQPCLMNMQYWSILRYQVVVGVGAKELGTLNLKKLKFSAIHPFEL